MIVVPMKSGSGNVIKSPRWVPGTPQNARLRFTLRRKLSSGWGSILQAAGKTGIFGVVATVYFIPMDRRYV